MNKEITNSVARVNNCTTMKTEDHFKNGVNPKNQGSRKNFLIICAMVLLFCGSTSKTVGQTWLIGHNPIPGGHYSSHVTATLNQSTNTLTINGNGNMADFWCTGVNQYDNGGEAPWWFDYRNVIQTVVFQNGSNVQNIGMKAFNECINLKTIIIPSSVIKINAKAFYGCVSLKKIIIPNSVTKIEGEAFRNCSSLQNVEIANGYSNLEFSSYYTNDPCFGNYGERTRDWFRDCTVLDSLFLGRNLYDWWSSNDERSPFYWIKNSLTTLTIGCPVTSITNYGFDNFSNLETIKIEDCNNTLYFPSAGVLTHCFNGCNNIQTLYLGRDLWGYSSFSGKEKLSTVTIGEKVTSLLYAYFNNCTGLTKITSHPKTPPNDAKFDNVNKTIPIFIDCDYLTAYKNALCWKDFTNYQCIVPVTNIILDVPNTIMVGKSLELKGTVKPDNATYKNIVWSVEEANGTGAKITQGNILTTEVYGDFSIIATADNGNFTITFPFKSIDIILDVPNTIVVGESLELKGTVKPDNAPYKDMVWSVEEANGTGAKITQDNILTTEVNGSFSIKATIINGKYSDLTKIFPFYSALSVTDINSFQIAIFPNPTTGELQVFSFQFSVFSIEVFDVYGRKLLSNHLITSSSHHLINISHLPAGLYFVKIRTELGEVVKKVVKL